MKRFPDSSFEQIADGVDITSLDLEQVEQCRRPHNKLGFAYQLAFVKLLNYFPKQQPFEVSEGILDYISLRLDIPAKFINQYQSRRETIAEHQKRIIAHLGLGYFHQETTNRVQEYIFRQACNFEQTRALEAKTKEFLKRNRILQPSDDTLRRLIGARKKAAQTFIFQKIKTSVSSDIIARLDSLLDVGDKSVSNFHALKQPPGLPSPASMLQLADKLETIESVGALDVDLSWLNNNFQRYLSRYARNADTARMRRLDAGRRYSTLLCFLRQNYRDTVDFMVSMYDRLINKVYNRSQREVDDHDKTRRRMIRSSLANYRTMSRTLLDKSVDDSAVRRLIFAQIPEEEISGQTKEVDVWLNGKHSHVFKVVKSRFSYIRRFSPCFLRSVELEDSEGDASSLLEAVDTLRRLNAEGTRKLTEDVPMDFIPKKIRSLVNEGGEPDKAAWECAVLTAVRDQIKSGNLSVRHSKRFGSLEDFFIPQEEWSKIRERFFQRAGLPADPSQAKKYLRDRLKSAFDDFLEALPDNTHVSIDDEGWSLSSDPAEEMEIERQNDLKALKTWLSRNMKVVKLPELLIDVDNRLKISRFFIPPPKRDKPRASDIREVWAAIMAYGCSIGGYTMSRITEGVSYRRIKSISEWMLTEEAQRSALAAVVNAISGLDISRAWGEGRTSSSDGQRFVFKRKVLQQTFNFKFHEFAMEFYHFIADNYAPYYSEPTDLGYHPDSCVNAP